MRPVSDRGWTRSVAGPSGVRRPRQCLPAVSMRYVGSPLPRRQFDAWQEWAKQRGAKGLAYVLVGADGELGGPVAKNLSE